jgi:hypothetical protein
MVRPAAQFGQQSIYNRLDSFQLVLWNRGGNVRSQVLVSLRGEFSEKP